MCLATLADLFAPISRDVAIVISVALLLCILPVMVLILLLIDQAKHELATDHYVE